VAALVLSTEVSIVEKPAAPAHEDHSHGGHGHSH
jgi:hypothetical protein